MYSPLLRSRFARIAALAAAAMTVALAPVVPSDLTTRRPPVTVSFRNWGEVTEPVYGTSEAGIYSGTELFAGPAKFDRSYFHGVLPNGRIVRPAGTSVQVGMNPLGAALTPDGKFLITSNDDERNPGSQSLINPENTGGFSLSVINTATMKVVSEIAAGPVFIGLQVSGAGPYTLWVSGGPSNGVRLFTISALGVILPATPASIPIAPLLPKNAGYVSNYTPDPAFDTPNERGNKPPVPSGFERVTGAHITFPAGSALSPNGRYLYVACNGDNSLAIIDTRSKRVVQQIAVGYFPYGVAVSPDGTRVAVSNQGLMPYRFRSPRYDSTTGVLKALIPISSNQPDGFYVPGASGGADSGRPDPRSSSVWLIRAPDGRGSPVKFLQSLDEGKPLDELTQVGGTHPSAMAVVRRRGLEMLYVAKANEDSLGMIELNTGRLLPDFDLSPVRVQMPEADALHGAYPNAAAASPDGSRLYVAEAGINSVAVLDIRDLVHPKLLGRLPTGWYPSSLVVSRDGRFLYITNAKGIGEDINRKTRTGGPGEPTGVESFKDSNFVFGTVQKVDLRTLSLSKGDVPANNFAVHMFQDNGVVPIGGHPSPKIKHVFFILHENKTFDAMLGNLSAHFGPYASLTYNNPDGTAFSSRQETGVSRNTQILAQTFAAAVNYYSDSEESDAGHQYCASGTASDYTEKTLLVKNGRGLLVNKNFEPEDYPENGYLFNNAARHGVSFKDYGDMIRIAGTDTGSSKPTSVNDPTSGLAGAPALQPDHLTVTNPLVNRGDASSPTSGLGQSYFLALPVLAVLGGVNGNGEARLDRNYPGYNFNISDQRRAEEFCRDFDRMTARGTLPQLLYIYQPNDHTGAVEAPNRSAARSSPLQQVADGDVALGMVVQHIMSSPIYYDAATGDGSAIFITYDDAQSGRDHIHQHRTPLIVVSPYAKPGYVARRHYSTASIVKTEELLLGLPPNNLGDFFATDLRDLFQPPYNGIRAGSLAFSRMISYHPSPEAARIWTLAGRLDTSAPDRDSARLGRLTRLCVTADELRSTAARKGTLQTRRYLAAQAALYRRALSVVQFPSLHDSDGD